MEWDLIPYRVLQCRLPYRVLQCRLPYTHFYISCVKILFYVSYFICIGMSRVRFPMVSLGFFIDINLPAALWPSGDSASNRNEYQECFFGVKAAGAYGWQPYHLHVPIVLKTGSLNLLNPSGPVQACNGIALPLPLPERRKSFIAKSPWLTLFREVTAVYLRKRTKIKNIVWTKFRVFNEKKETNCHSSNTYINKINFPKKLT